MPVSALARDIRRFHELTAIVKPAEKELEALKARFRAEAGPAKDTVWQDEAKGLEVVCTREEQTRLDLEAVRAKLGEEAKAFEKVSTILKVTGRAIAEPVKAGAPKKAKKKVA